MLAEIKTDADLPDATGLDGLRRMKAMASHLPVLVLTGLDDETLAVEAVRQGALDYVVKGRAAT